ncbi:TatD family hydrolase [Phycisphaerales bacterium AB-hyl4]|uniref:TatD family hydrolase n=1 Tax=Natronomicrosphaera hydrolytica TaxID=3242702 RepID=A0ABV4TZS1_9BACT
MIDTHCHLTFPGLFEQVDAVLARARGAGVDRMISVATTPDDAKRAAALAVDEAGVFATVGVHPHYAGEWADRDALVEAMLAVAGLKGVVAWGEMGLDYHYDEPTAEVQRQVFAWQLEVVREHGGALPVVIHNREATDDVLAMIREAGLAGERFVFHCFTGSRAELEAVLAIGAMVSFTGIVTFNSARDLAAASDVVPLERLMVETDSPYLTPEPYRKVRPNEPRYVREVARFLAKRRGMSEAEFVKVVDGNAERFFGLRG